MDIIIIIAFYFGYVGRYDYDQAERYGEAYINFRKRRRRNWINGILIYIICVLGLFAFILYKFDPIGQTLRYFEAVQQEQVQTSQKMSERLKKESESIEKAQQELEEASDAQNYYYPEETE